MSGTACPFLIALKTRGFTQILLLAAEGTAFPKLAGRSDDRPSQTRGAFGLQELQPSFPPSLGKDQVHPAAHSKRFIRGMPHALKLIPATARAILFFISG